MRARPITTSSAIPGIPTLAARCSQAACVALLIMFPVSTARARPPIRSDFFTVYPQAVGTRLDVLPSNSHHCGVCHFDFNGGGPRNPFGTGVEVGRAHGLTNQQAILAIETTDSDADGHVNRVEITELTLFTNTPTFPGLSQSNLSGVLNIPLGEIQPYLTPAGATDTTPPAVTVGTPNGGSSVQAGQTVSVTYNASDASGISYVNLYLSDNGGVSFKLIGRNQPSSGSFPWFVPNLPGSASRIRVQAFDNAGNQASDQSDGDFTIVGSPPGVVPTTLRDMELPGTHPLEGAVLDDVDQVCVTCHGNYATAVEPWANWRGSMMGQAMRDPLFLACMVVAEQDAPSVGDLCIRCHSPGGWQEGRSVDTHGGLLTAKDRQGVQCDFCHRMVDFNYVAGVSPSQDPAVLAAIAPLPAAYANGQFINDPQPLRRGPFADAQASHAFVASPFHRSSNLCGTCHDVSNPVFQRVGPGDYAPTGFDQQHPTMDLRNMFPVERTFSEWSQSAYAADGVYAPQFAGNKPDGIVSTCQDCHLHDVSGRGCSENGMPLRADLPLHDLTGGNAFIPDVLAEFYPGEVDATQLAAAKSRTLEMLQKAATLQVTAEDFGVTVRVINETGHKFPSGYPEGRRIWIHVEGIDGSGATIFESGAYDAQTALLAPDPQLKVYEIHAGLSPGLAGALGLPPGPSFHFVLNDSVFSDNRIPPRGSTLAGLAAVQSPPVDHAYEDGQYWDDTPYFIPAQAESARVTLYYQTLSKEYVEFLRDANVTNAVGQQLYDAWATHGKSSPVAMARTTVPVTITATAVGEPGPGEPGASGASGATLVYGLGRPHPNPFGAGTAVVYSLPRAQHVLLAIYDVRGRRVRSLVDADQAPGRYATRWDGRDGQGSPLASGTYFLRYVAGDRVFNERLMLVR